MENVFIAGASRGLGLALAEGYLAEGCRVFAGVRSVQADGLRKLAGKYPRMLFPVRMDAAQTQQVREAARQVKETASQLDVVIYNAGVHFKENDCVLEDADMERCLETYNVNALGALRVAQAFAPLLTGGGRKVLANISSEAGSIADCARDKWFDYCMSKAALNMESKLLQNDLGKRGVKVLAIHPGWMRTDMGGMEADISPEESAAGIMKVIEKYGNADSPVLYVDYTGKPMNY